MPYRFRPACAGVCVLVLVLLAGCRLEEPFGPDYETWGQGAGAFGFHALVGDLASVDLDRVIAIKRASVYDTAGRKNPQDADVFVNGISIEESGVPEHDFVAGAPYTIRVVTEEGTVQGRLTAPGVSRIALVNLPVLHEVGTPLAVRWTFPPGEENDGALLVTTSNGYSSGLLAPGTRAHTIPAEVLTGINTTLIQVVSVRYLLFRNLLRPDDSNTTLADLDEKGSHFGLFVGITQQIELRRRVE